MSKVEGQKEAAYSKGSASVSTAVSGILRDTFSMTGRAMRPRSADSFRKMIEPRINVNEREKKDRGSRIVDCRWMKPPLLSISNNPSRITLNFSPTSIVVMTSGLGDDQALSIDLINEPVFLIDAL